MSNLQEYLHNYINSPRDPMINALLGEEYEKIGQGAAATSYFLRAAELWHDTEKELAYNCFLKTWKQLHNTKRREGFEIGQLKLAIAYLPTRPEAYYHASLWYSNKKEWVDSYMFAQLGLKHINKSIGKPLKFDINYPGDYALKFQKAFSSWYIGKRELSKKLFLELYNDQSLPLNFKRIVTENCQSFNLIKF
jgi:hypothetical protein|tara:strand:+ start:731 stop:1309 length:579 start_codon:yes stop_codon:yes gene_type:complete